MGNEKEKVTLDLGKIKNRSNIQQRVEEVEVPEFNELLGLEEGKVAVVKVTQLSLDIFLKSRDDLNDRIRNLLEGIVEASAKKEDVVDEVEKIQKKMHPETKYRLSIIREGLVEPVMSNSDLVFFSKMFPLAMNRIYDAIMKLTSQGANIKKNS